MTGIRQHQVKSPPPTCGGFTLIETVVGTALIVGVFAALLVAIAYGYDVMRATSESRRATEILVERLEGLRLYTWNQIVYGNMVPTTFVSYYNPPDDSDTNAGSGVLYNGSLSISNVTFDPLPSYSPNLRQVTVSVTWTTYGIARQRSLSTFVARDGIQNYVYSH